MDLNRHIRRYLVPCKETKTYTRLIRAGSFRMSQIQDQTREIKFILEQEKEK